MGEKHDTYDKIFRDAEGRRKTGGHLIREARAFLDKYDPELVETIRHRKEAGESLMKIYLDLGEKQEVIDIAMHLAVLKQGEDIKNSD